MYSALGGLQRQAQHRLLVEVVLTEDDAAGPDTKQEMAEGCEDSDGLGTQRSSCPSRDRARASLRRLRPTAWRCTQPDAHAAAINESEGSEPLSQLLQAVATTGKRLPWAHLAAREEAAAVGMGVSTSGRGADGDQTEADTRQGKQQQSAAQDWSWLASPPWGVVPLPPELACRVGPDARLRPGTCGAAEAIATHAESVTSACPPHAHSDPHCAQLHTQLHRMTAAVQQVLAVAAAANLAADAADAQAASLNASSPALESQPLPTMRGERWRLHIPTWQEGISQAGGPIALAQVSSSVHTRAATYTEGFAGGPGKPLVLGKSPVSTQPAINRKAVALLCKASLACQEDLEMRLSACERLRPLLLAGRGRQQQQPGRGQQDRQQHMIMAAWRGGRRQVQELLACLIDPASREPLQAAPAAAAGPRRRGSSAWRRLEDAVVNHWAPDKRKMLWAWLLEMAAEAEEAEAEAEAERTAAADASRGLWPAGVSMVEDADVISAWGTAATEVLRGAVCFLAMYGVLNDAIPAEPVAPSSSTGGGGAAGSAAASTSGAGGDSGGTEGGLDAPLEPLMTGGCNEQLLERVMDQARGFDPLVMAVAFPTFLLARALKPDRHVHPLYMHDTLLLGQLPDLPDLHWPAAGPAAKRSPAVRRRRDGGPPPPPPLSYAHCLEVMDGYLREPHATITMFRALWHRGEDISIAVRELVRGWYDAWQAELQAAAIKAARLASGRDLAHEMWRRCSGVLSDGELRELLLELWGPQAIGAAAAVYGGWGGGAAGAAAQHLPSLPVSDVVVAAAHDDLALYARSAGVVEALAAVHECRPAAAALAAALRALKLLRIVPGAVPPASYLTSEAARLANAGVAAAPPPPLVAAALAAAGGGCDLVRLRVPPPGDEAVSAAALLMGMSVHTLSFTPEIVSSGNRLMLQPAFGTCTAELREPQPQQQAAAAGSGGSRAKAAPAAGAVSSSGGRGGAGGGGGSAAGLVVDVCRAFSPSWPQSDAEACASKWPYPWLAVRELAVVQWSDSTSVREMVAFLRLNLIQRHLGICAAGVQGVAALARVLTAVAKLREELRPAGGAAPTRDVAVGINKVLEYGDGPRLPLPAAGAAECSSSDSGAGEGGAAAAHSTVLEDELTLYQLFDYLVTRAREAQLVMPHLRQELKLPAGRPAAGGAGAGGKSNGRGSSQLHSQPQLQPEPLTASLVEVVTPPCGGGGHDHGHGPAGRVGQAAETDAELAAAAVISRLKLREAPVETPLLRDRKGEHRKLPHHHLKLDVWFYEVAPGRPWQLVLPPAERVADWNKKLAMNLLTNKR